MIQPTTKTFSTNIMIVTIMKLAIAIAERLVRHLTLQQSLIMRCYAWNATITLVFSFTSLYVRDGMLATHTCHMYRYGVLVSV